MVDQYWPRGTGGLYMRSFSKNNFFFYFAFISLSCNIYRPLLSGFIFIYLFACLLTNLLSFLLFC
jgi:hypothetical protein